jgi:hypothetical protein
MMNPVDRLMGQVLQYTPVGVPAPDVHQVAAVLHALADHTSLLMAVGYTRSGNPALNVGRWLHAYGDTMSASAR